MQVKRLKLLGFLPRRATDGSAGYDLSCIEDITTTRGLNKIPLGIALAIPHGHYARIACRSSLALKDMSVEAGVVDEDYTGEIIVLLRDRRGGHEFKYGDRFAQMIITPYASPLVEEVSELQSSIRGDGGFGSTYH